MTIYSLFTLVQVLGSSYRNGLFTHLIFTTTHKQNRLKMDLQLKTENSTLNFIVTKIKLLLKKRSMGAAG